MHCLTVLACCLPIMGVASRSDDTLPPGLTAMIETERSFARAAARNGVRDAFLEFFADDSIAFADGPVPAKEGIRKSPSRPPSSLMLTWEPRYGDIAASGELGYLTGPATRVSHEGADTAPEYLCYFSIWRKQADGTFKVIIDQGVHTPAPVEFTPGFSRAMHPRATATAESGDRTARLAQSDRAVGAAGATSLLNAYEPVLADGARLYRDGMMPLVGKQAIEEYLRRQPPATMSAESLYAEVAISGELGYTYGRYTTTSARLTESGHYVRIWRKDVQNRWRIALDVNAPRPPKP